MSKQKEAFEKFIKSLQQAFDDMYPEFGSVDDMYPVFDRIEEVIRDGGCLYRPCLTTDHWEIDNVNGDSLATGKTFRELCVNLIMADGKDEK